MFVTDLVRNLAWSLRQSRRRLSGQDSVLPADAIAPVAPARREPSRPGPSDAEAASRRRETTNDVPTEQAVDATTEPANNQPHIDVEA